MNIGAEPHSLDPAAITLSDGMGFLYQNIYRGLFVYRGEKILDPQGAKHCQIKSLVVDCELDPKFLWSDGKPVEAKEYVAAFRHLMSRNSKSSIVHQLKTIENATEVFGGQKPPESLGIEAVSPTHLRFRLNTNDPDFLYRLSSPLTAPIRSENFPTIEKADEALVTGPFKISKWVKGRRIDLVQNSKYRNENTNAPKVEIYFVEEEQTALNLYETQKLDFLWRLPTALIPIYKTHKDFVQLAMARFDYIGFSPKFHDQPNLRKALALSLDYNELQKVFAGDGLPGCPALPDNYLREVHCIKMDLPNAQKAWAEAKDSTLAKHLKYVYSHLGGQDVLRAAEWTVEQWKSHLGASIEIQTLENAVFVAKLKTDPPDIFRKSVQLERPSCLNAIENFTSGAPENFMKLAIPRLDEIVSKLKTEQTLAGQRSLCSESVQVLLKDYWLIPLGQMHFTMLIQPHFNGWRMNEFGQLDLSHLTTQP